MLSEKKHKLDMGREMKPSIKYFCAGGVVRNTLVKCRLLVATAEIKFTREPPQNSS